MRDSWCWLKRRYWAGFCCRICWALVSLKDDTCQLDATAGQEAGLRGTPGPRPSPPTHPQGPRPSPSASTSCMPTDLVYFTRSERARDSFMVFFCRLALGGGRATSVRARGRAPLPTQASLGTTVCEPGSLIHAKCPPNVHRAPLRVPGCAVDPEKRHGGGAGAGTESPPKNVSPTAVGARSRHRGPCWPVCPRDAEVPSLGSSSPTPLCGHGATAGPARPTLALRGQGPRHLPPPLSVQGPGWGRALTLGSGCLGSPGPPPPPPCWPPSLACCSFSVWKESGVKLCGAPGSAAAPTQAGRAQEAGLPSWGPGTQAARLSRPVLCSVPVGLGPEGPTALAGAGQGRAIEAPALRSPRQTTWLGVQRGILGGRPGARRAGGDAPGWPAQGQLGKREDGAWWALAKWPRPGAPPDLALGEAAHKDPVVPSAGPGVLPGLHVLLGLGDRETEVTGSRRRGGWLPPRTWSHSPPPARG